MKKQKFTNFKKIVRKLLMYEKKKNHSTTHLSSSSA